MALIVGAVISSHNYYVQYAAQGWSDLVFVIYILFIYVYIESLKKNLLPIKNFYVFIGALIINFFPLVPTGNYFNNFLTILSFLPIVYLIKLKYVFR